MPFFFFFLLHRTRLEAKVKLKVAVQPSRLSGNSGAWIAPERSGRAVGIPVPLKAPDGHSLLLSFGFVPLILLRFFFCLTHCSTRVSCGGVGGGGDYVFYLGARNVEGILLFLLFVKLWKQVFFFLLADVCERKVELWNRGTGQTCVCGCVCLSSYFVFTTRGSALFGKKRSFVRVCC